MPCVKAAIRCAYREPPKKKGGSITPDDLSDRVKQNMSWEIPEQFECVRDLD